MACSVRPDWARGRRVLGGSSGGKWNGRLADSFVHLENTDRLLCNSMEHVETFKADTREKLRGWVWGMRYLSVPGEVKRMYQERKHNLWYIPCFIVTSIYKVILNPYCWFIGKLLFNYIGKIGEGKAGSSTVAESQQWLSKIEKSGLLIKTVTVHTKERFQPNRSMGVRPGMGRVEAGVLFHDEPLPLFEKITVTIFSFY